MKTGLFTIPASTPFAAALARGVLSECGDDPAVLSRVLILLPTRRAVRSVREAFLTLSGGKPMLLPQLQPLGDIDEEELFLNLEAADIHPSLTLAPSMPPLRRQMILARLLAAKEGEQTVRTRHMSLAAALGRLLDQVQTEGLDLADLPGLLESQDYAAHWQITTDFLTILSHNWPEILAESGMVDASARRGELLRALAAYWQSVRPQTRIIAAGSTGSIPDTAAVLETIATLPNGAVILPGLDTQMTADTWDALDDTHPQATIKRFLQRLDKDRTQVQLWEQAAERPTREKLASELMRPAATSEDWQKTRLSATELDDGLKNLYRLDCPTAQDEALCIALLLRETLEKGEKTAALVTPDRTLARRVAALCTRWGISLDDSAGTPLHHSPAGSFFLCIARAVEEAFTPGPLLALLKHPACAMGIRPAEKKAMIARLEIELLRGPAPEAGLSGLLTHLARKTRLAEEKGHRPPDPALATDINRIGNILSPFIQAMNNDNCNFKTLLTSHIEAAQFLNTDRDGTMTLWQGEDGQTLSALLAGLLAESAHMPGACPGEYSALMTHFLQAQTVRPAYGTHPRLMILGQLEARLLQADRVILGGLNEGIWPPEPAIDPFLSRPMKQKFGLPSPDRAVGLAAHDFIQGFCAKEVFLTRAERQNGNPSLPSRWLDRLDTVLKAHGKETNSLYRHNYAHWAQLIDKVDKPSPYARPEPRPSRDLRPQRLSVTRIETLIFDPYAIFARSVLRLEKLEPLAAAPGAKERGNLIHKALEIFIRETLENGFDPATASNRLTTILQERLPDYLPGEAQARLNLPRLRKIADWFSAQEQKWRENGYIPAALEAHAEWTLSQQEGVRPFILHGYADRIDRRNDGTLALIDYKSGGGQSKARMKNGELPQLPLEAIMAAEGGFDILGKKMTSYLGYWVVNGSGEGGNVNITLTGEAEIAETMATVREGLLSLIALFDQEETPYYALPYPAKAPRFQDYAHLARQAEWVALDEGENEEAAL